MSSGWMMTKFTALVLDGIAASIAPDRADEARENFMMKDDYFLTDTIYIMDDAWIDGDIIIQIVGADLMVR